MHIESLIRPMTILWINLPTHEMLNPKRSEEHTSELQSLRHLVCRLVLEKKKQTHFGNPTPQIPKWNGEAACLMLMTNNSAAISLRAIATESIRSRFQLQPGTEYGTGVHP